MSTAHPPALIKRRRRTNPGQGESSREASCESNVETDLDETDSASILSLSSRHSFEPTSIPSFAPPAAKYSPGPSKRHPQVQSPNGPPLSILGRPLPETDGEGDVSEGSAGHDGDISSATAPSHRPLPTAPRTAANPILVSTSSIISTSTNSSPPSPSPRDSPTPGSGVGPESRHPGHGSSPPLWAAAPQGFLSNMTAEEVQDHIKKAIEGAPGREYRIKEPPVGRPVRIYADGVYDLLHYGHMLQLRQCKLAFPSVHLLVGVCSDEIVRKYKASPVLTSQERYESVRHCKWVDEVVENAPWIIDEAFIKKHKIDYVAHDEEPYKSAGADDVYAFPKSIGSFLPTKRTNGVSTSELLQRIVEGYREGEYDSKFIKLGLPELCSTRHGSEAGTHGDKMEDATAVDETVAAADDSIETEDVQEGEVVAA